MVNLAIEDNAGRALDVELSSVGGPVHVEAKGPDMTATRVASWGHCQQNCRMY